MIQRCTNPNRKAYKNYGGRGITVCDSWSSYDVFLKDMGERPAGKTLDRIDNSRGYYKGNCKWSTPREQKLNQRPCSKYRSAILISPTGVGYYIPKGGGSKFATDMGLNKSAYFAVLSGKYKHTSGWTGCYI